MEKYVLEFSHVGILDYQNKLIADAWKLNNELIKLKLTLANIPYNIILDDCIMVDMAYHGSTHIDVPRVLEDRSLFHACLAALGVKINNNDSNH